MNARFPQKPPLRVSFEFFPPKDEGGFEGFMRAAKKLATLDPTFVSVTYGAGGTTRERTISSIKRLAAGTALRPAAHLTCVGATKDEVNAVVRDYWDAGIRHIVALRGDPPGGVGLKFVPHPGGYNNAADLVRGIREIGDFEISVSAYPEKHPESVSLEEDLAFLADKVDHGAQRALTQFFFSDSAFLRFRDRVYARGIDVELVPGILPVTNVARALEFAKKCGAFVPPAFAKRFDGLDQEPDTRNLVAAMVAAEQVRTLEKEGVSSFHFYTLNRADLVYAICRVLGLNPTTAAIAA